MILKNTTNNSRIIFFILFFHCIFFTTVLSCTTPVFRYALERWPAYLYKLEIIHNGNLNEAQKHALNLLNTSSADGIKANLKVVEISDTNNNEFRKEKFPLIRLFYPKEFNRHGLIWQGELSNENVKKILNSPARRKAIHQIQKGDAVVWFFLDRGKRNENNKLARLLEDQLNQLSDELKLSSYATDASGKPLDIHISNNKVKFSMVRVSNTNPEEEIFVKMLLGTEPDLASFHTPLAFPVFGRGRVLYALAGKGIKHELIKSACNAIIGWCSCTIKEDNPGTDLLFMANWEKAIGDTPWIHEEMPEITGLSDFIPSGDKKRVTEEIENNVEEKEKPGKEKEIVLNSDKQNTTITEPLLRNILVVITFLVIAMPVVYFVIKRRTEK